MVIDGMEVVFKTKLLANKPVQTVPDFCVLLQAQWSVGVIAT
jgi:hypothetical protein